MQTHTGAPARAHRTPTPIPAPIGALPRRAALVAAALATLIVALGLALGQASPALAHDQLVGLDGQLDPDGTHVTFTLQFSDEVMDVGAEIVATGADGAELADGAPEVSGRDVTQRISFPGFGQTVTVAWRVVSSDGHPITDRFAFAVVEQDGGTRLEFSEPADADSGGGTDAGHADGAEHDDAEHDHSAPTGEADSAGGSPVATVVTVAVVALAAAGAVVAVIVGGRRRRRAFDEAAGRSAADGSAAPGETPTGQQEDER